MKITKIKRKVQKNLPQLIEWVEKNGVRNHVFISDIDRNEVEINIHGRIFCKHITLKDTFTVTTEEEITEEIKLDLLLDHFINPYGQHHVGNIYLNRSINDILEENDEMEIATYSIHLFDIETNEFKLIWCNGKLVE